MLKFNKKAKYLILLLLLYLCFCLPSFADDISFSAGNTSLQMKGEEKTIQLSEGAKIDTGDVKIEADNVKITGEGYSNLQCEGNVYINDFKHRITIYSTSLIYNRNTQSIVVDGWIELQDLNNQVAASSAWLDFNMNEGILKMQIRAKIIKRTEKGAMVCRADNIIFNRDNNTLILNGNSSVNWDGNSYNANNIQVDLKTEEIKMIGEISGSIKS